ncbi:DEAD-box ATP-dependent RNA helicase 13-like [Arachis ipaensis]|uniref:DEAD-box ATP-dependent RNA helicase 13-like n=1 Tax=Arachis ipaensis TaxID=130454 RepID=UPI000A2B7335|nr:DEAD-box ATP-dependent RNA helicase 13-like [Arachis ipaensis]XP_025656221.1 DEAD-box ATP-dependent RNA helicase 13 isoform X2 [Arachis hypogaea]
MEDLVAELNMPKVLKRLSLARQIDKITPKNSQVKAEKNWFDRNANSVELVTENDDGKEEQVNKHKQMKTSSKQLKTLQQVRMDVKDFA